MSALKEEAKANYFNLPSPVQGLTVAISGIKIISCIAEKINRVRDRVSEAVAKDSKDKKKENVSLLTLVLSTFTDLKGRIAEVRIFSNASTQQAPEDSQEQHGVLGRCMSESAIGEVIGPKKSRLHRSCSLPHHMHISKWKHATAVHRTHVPHHMREPYIEHGYFLPFMPWSYYLKALYTPSYELMNVWTHLIPSLYFFYLLFAFSQEVSVYKAWPLFVITSCAAVMTGVSAMAHLFHSRSSLHHSCCFMADYFGITLYAFASLLSNFYSGAQPEYYNMLSGFYLPIALTLAGTGFTCLCVTQTGSRFASIHISRQMKVYVNGLGYVFGLIPIYRRMYENMLIGRQEPALWCHGMAMLNLVFAPIIYGSDLPQRLSPGRFDVFGHSHMLFHIFTALAGYFDIHAVYYDVVDGPWKVLHTQDDYPTVGRVAVFYCALFAYGIIVGCVTRHIIKEDHAHERPILQGKVLCECGLPETAQYHTKTE